MLFRSGCYAEPLAVQIAIGGIGSDEGRGPADPCQSAARAADARARVADRRRGTTTESRIRRAANRGKRAFKQWFTLGRRCKPLGSLRGFQPLDAESAAHVH